MKKLFERIAYTLFGAILVFVVHYIGSTDNKADAQFTTFEDVEITGRLTVKGGIVVGDPTAPHGNLVIMRSDSEDASIAIVYNLNQLNNTSDATVTLAATESDNNPSANIILVDKFGNKSLGTSKFGWLNPDDIPK